MDIEAVSSLCPNCKIELVEATAADAQDLQSAITSAIGAGANQVSISGDGVYSQRPVHRLQRPGRIDRGGDGWTTARYPTARMRTQLPFRM